MRALPPGAPSVPPSPPELPTPHVRPLPSTAFIHAASHLSDEALRSIARALPTACYTLTMVGAGCTLAGVLLVLAGSSSGVRPFWPLSDDVVTTPSNGPGLAAAPGAQDETASSMSTEAIEMAHTVSRTAEPDLLHTAWPISLRVHWGGHKARRHMLSSVTKPGVSRAVYDGVLGSRPTGIARMH